MGTPSLRKIIPLSMSSLPLKWNALAWGNEELVQLLLQHGATPGGMGAAINPSGNTPLHSPQNAPEVLLT